MGNHAEGSKRTTQSLQENAKAVWCDTKLFLRLRGNLRGAALLNKVYFTLPTLLAFLDVVCGG